MKRKTVAGLVDCRGRKPEYWPGFGNVSADEVCACIDQAYAKMAAKNRLKLAAFEHFHGTGANHWKYRTKIPERKLLTGEAGQPNLSSGQK